MPRVISTTWFEDIGYLHQPILDFKLARLSIRQTAHLFLWSGIAYLFFKSAAGFLFSSFILKAAASLAILTAGMVVFARRGKVFSPEWYLYYFARKYISGLRSGEEKKAEAGVTEAKEPEPSPSRMVAPMGEPARIGGVLYDPSTGKRLSKVNYEVRVDGEPYHSGRTDGDGEYSFIYTPPDPGRHIIEVFITGHSEPVEKIKIEGEEASTPTPPASGDEAGRTVGRESLKTGSVAEDTSSEGESDKYVYELFPTNFVDLPREEQNSLVNSFRRFLNSLDCEVKIVAKRSTKKVEVGNRSIEPEFFKYYVVSEELIDANLNTAGIFYQRTTESPEPEVVRTFKDFSVLKGGRNQKTGAVYEMGESLIEGFPSELHSAADRITISLDPVDQGDAVREMERFMDMKTAISRSGGGRGETAEAERAQEALRRLSEGGSRLFKVKISVTAGGETEEEMESNYDQLESNCQGRRVGISDPPFVQEELLRGDLGKRLYMDTVTLGAFYPFVSAEVMESHGVLLGFNRYTKSPVIYDPLIRPNGHMALIGVSGSGKCLAGSTKVVDGETGELREIEDMVNDRDGNVLSLKEDWKVSKGDVSEFHSNGVKDVYELATRTGRKIKATENHPFLTIKGWKNLGELEPGDRIAAPREIPVFGDLEVPDYKLKVLAYLLGGGHARGFNITFTGDKDRTRDFALSVERFPRSIANVKKVDGARGSFEVRVRGYEIRSDANVDLNEIEERYDIGELRGKTQNNQKTEIQKELYDRGLSLQQIAELFECTVAGVSYQLEGAGVLEKGRGKSGVREWLENLGVHGRLSTEKKIPDFVFKLEKEKLKLFLNRLFACDGWMGKWDNGNRIQVGYSSSSEVLAKQVQHLLLRFGVLSRLREKQTDKNPNYLVEIDDVDNVRRFIEEIGDFGRESFEEVKEIVKGRGPNPNLDLVSGSVWDRVRGIKFQQNRTWKEVGEHLGYERPKGFSGAQYRSPSRKTLKAIADAWDSEEIRRLAESDVFWDEVVSINPAGREEVYDVTVNPAHNFVANDIISHNSYATKTYLTRLFQKNPDIAYFIVDPENEYIHTAMDLDPETQVHHISRDRRLGLDPLKLFKSKDVALEILVDVLDLGDKEPDLLSELRKAVQNSDSLGEVREAAGEKLTRRLDGLLESPKGFLFKGKKRNVSSRAVFNLEDLHRALKVSDKGKDTLHIASLLVFGQMWRKIEELPRDKLKAVVVDEVWLYTEVPAAASFLEYVSRRGRKRNVLFVLASQHPSDVLNSESGRNAIQNCATKVILQQDKASSDLVASAFDLTERDIKASLEFEAGEAILTADRIRTPLQFFATPEEHRLFTTKPGERLG